MKKEIALAGLLGMLLYSPAIIAQQTRTVPPYGQFPDLVGGLQKTPGCLKVDTARTTSGKQVIFAWFENKRAVLTWYYSEPHIAAMRLTGSEPGGRPLANVPDDDQPVLAVASVTVNGNPTPDQPMALSQIAIELYRPLPGGIAVGGRFGPDNMKVPGLRDLSISGEAR